MSIQDEIDVKNRITLSEKSSIKFKSRDETSKKKWVKPKPPQARGSAANIENLYDPSFFEDNENADENNKKITNGTEDDFQEESYMKIHLLYNGNPHANENITKEIQERQRRKKDNLKSSISDRDSTSSPSLTTSDNCSSLEDSPGCSGITKQQFAKNAAFTGLLNRNIIHLNDLKHDNLVSTRKSKSKFTEAAPRVDLSQYTGAGIPHPEDDNILVHRFLMGQGAPEIPGCDFKVDSMAIRTFVTPRQQLMQLTDEDFEFVKK